MFKNGKPSISMGHGFHSYVCLPEGKSPLNTINGPFPMAMSAINQRVIPRWSDESPRWSLASHEENITEIQPPAKHHRLDIRGYQIYIYIIYIYHIYIHIIYIHIIYIYIHIYIYISYYIYHIYIYIINIIYVSNHLMNEFYLGSIGNPLFPSIPHGFRSHGPPAGSKSHCRGAVRRGRETKRGDQTR